MGWDPLSSHPAAEVNDVLAALAWSDRGPTDPGAVARARLLNGPERGDRASGRNQLVLREVGEFVLLVAP